MSKTPSFLAAASAAALLALSACNQEDNNIVAGENDPQSEALKKAPPVTLPPAIKEAKTYRCKDNSLVYVTYMDDNVTALVRDKQEEPPVATLKAPAAGQPFVAEGFSLTVSGNTVTYNSPDAGNQSCKTSS